MKAKKSTAPAGRKSAGRKSGPRNAAPKRGSKKSVPTQGRTNGGPEIKRPPVLFAETQRTLAELGAALNCLVLSYWNSPGGSVCATDANAFYDVLQGLGSFDSIALVVKSSGGSGQDALRIVHMLRQHAKKLIVLCPLECASAATMIALGADEIQMGPLSYLTAVDTSLRHDLSPTDRDNRRVSVSQDELTRVVRLFQESQPPAADGSAPIANPYQFLYEHIHPLVIGAIDRISSLSIRICTEILSYHMPDREAAERISRKLNSDYPSHDYPITLREAQHLGLPAKAMTNEVHEIVARLNTLYSEMGQQAITDTDEFHHHNHEIVNVIEGVGSQILFQNDKDWTYLKDERRWVSLNDNSGWYRFTQQGKTMKRDKLHY